MRTALRGLSLTLERGFGSSKVGLVNLHQCGGALTCQFQASWRLWKARKLGMRSDPNFFKFFEDLGFTGAKNSEHCYSVEFSPKTRTICIEVFQSWLQREAKYVRRVETC